MNKPLKFSFNPHKKGLNQVLGTLEKDIVDALWECGEACIKEILESFPQDKNISYSTVITVTNRMTKKGLLKKRKVGKAYFYKPVYSKEQFYEEVSKAVVNGVSGFSFQTAMVHFVDYMAQIAPEKIEYFSQFIEAKKKALKTTQANDTEDK